MNRVNESQPPAMNHTDSIGVNPSMPGNARYTLTLGLKYTYHQLDGAGVNISVVVLIFRFHAGGAELIFTALLRLRQ